MGEEGRPQGVRVGGIWARGVKGGEGRAPRPVPPIIAIGTGSILESLGAYGGRIGGKWAYLAKWLGDLPY